MSRFGRIKKTLRANAGSYAKPVECLVSVAIERDGVVHADFKSHADLRTSLGDEDPYKRQIGDIEGFMTSLGRFVNRDEALTVAVKSKQVPERYEGMQRELLSSDIRW